MTFLALAPLLSLSACSNAYDTHLGSHTHDVLPIGAMKSMYMVTVPQRTQIFVFQKKSCILLCSGLLWSYTMILVAPIDNTSLVCDPKWVSYALEQAERLISHAIAKEVLHNFSWNPLYNKVMHKFAWTPLHHNMK